MIDMEREIKTRRHYHVLSGLQGGYLPNNNETYTTRKDAESAARWQANNARENNWDVEPEYQRKVSGSASAGFYTIGEYEYISIDECNDSACVCQDCGELLPGEGDDIHHCS